ncbi:MAG: PAC2 family protein, partial [Candidatus Woesearchaeota archaeon]|nr:PAC2 family protein [Candidatus Woesearchaeota archaeon]
SVLFLAGDIEPTSEKSCYEFCHTLLDKFHNVKNMEIVTLGGIALPSIPENPKVYCTGNSKKSMQKYAATTDTKIHGVVGPIIGVSGVLPALAGKRNIPSVALLAETFGHPQYMGIKGAKELLKVLQKELKTKIDVSELQEDGSILTEKKRSALKIEKLKKAVTLKETNKGNHNGKETTYIG